MAAAPEIAYGLETPYPLQPSQNYFRLEGWALIRNADTPTLTRIRIDQQCFAPESNPVRPDVAVSHPDDPFASNSGFTFVCFLPFGNHLGLLEASVDNGETWHLVKSMIIPVSSHPLMGNFEPAGTNGRLTETTRLAGWCWHPEFTIDQVVLLFGDIEVTVDFGLSRPDVVERFPDQPQSEFSGFMTCENLPRGKGKLRLQVTTTCGRVYFLDSELTATLPTGSFAPPRKTREMWDLDIHQNSRQRRTAATSVSSTSPAPTGASNILFVLYGDFTSNSAHHVIAFANELIARGYDCIVAVPYHMETIGAQEGSRFLAIEFDDIAEVPHYFRDGAGPALVHAWTTRQTVHNFCTQVKSLFASQLVIHLEDNEHEILARHLDCTLAELNQKTSSQLDKLVPPTLSHPHQAREFLQSAQGVSVIIDRLHEFVPDEVPWITIWPAARPAFVRLKLNVSLRAKLSIPPNDVVIFYHGNVHQANMAEMTELYRAIELLNHNGLPTWLIRAGRDSPEFSARLPAVIRGRLIEIGFVNRASDLARLMSAANFFVQPGQAGDFNDFRFPSKLPEFFSIGRPVILPRTNLGRTLKHGQNAYVLEDADAASIAAAIQKLKSDTTLTETLSDGAIQFAKTHFSWSRSTDQLVTFYHKVTNLGQPTASDRAAAQSVSAVYKGNSVS